MKLAPEIMNEVFDIIESPYPLRNELRSKSRNIWVVRHGSQTAVFVGSMICIYIPSELTKNTSINKFWSNPIKCAYHGVRNVIFSENFAYLLNE